VIVEEQEQSESDDGDESDELQRDYELPKLVVT